MKVYKAHLPQEQLIFHWGPQSLDDEDLLEIVPYTPLCLKTVCSCELVASAEGNAIGRLVGTHLIPASAEGNATGGLVGMHLIPASV